MDEARIRTLITELEGLAPLDGAVMRLDQDHTETDERVLSVHANAAGYLQVGVMFLQAAFAPAAGAPGLDGDELYVAVPPVIDDESTLTFGHFLRWDDVPPPRPLEKAAGGGWVKAGALVGCLGVVGILAVLSFIGFLQVVRSL